MCFSATASFTAAAALLPAGIYSSIRAYRVNKHYLLFACVPLIFSIQQFSEGMVWYNLAASQLLETFDYAYVYLFFAYAFWPFYIALSMYQVESNQTHKKWIKLFVWAGAALGMFMYLPVLLGYVPLSVSVIGKSIAYEAYESTSIIAIFITLYGFVLCTSMLLSTTRGMRLFGVLILTSLIATIIWYMYAFTSVWCFFSAILSLYVASVVCHISYHGST